MLSRGFLMLAGRCQTLVECLHPVKIWPDPRYWRCHGCGVMCHPRVMAFPPLDQEDQVGQQCRVWLDAGSEWPAIAGMGFPVSLKSKRRGTAKIVGI